MYQKRMCVFALALSLIVAGSAVAQLGQGKVLFEYWEGVGGTSINSNLKSLASYPNSPSWSEWRDGLKSQPDRADNYGVRARAYLTAPADGDYNFWVSGDDNCELWLSTDDTAAKAVKIAQVTGWTPIEGWTHEGAGQKSPAINLVGGQKYYIEMLMKEGGGGDSVTAAWAGPTIGDALTVIKGNVLTAFIRDPEPLFTARNPEPANGTADWMPTPMFKCTPGMFALMTNWYIGESPDAMAQVGVMIPGPDGKLMGFFTTELQPGATYYWRADTVEAAGVRTGDVWSFTVMPLKAHFPSPHDGAMWRSAGTTLSWTAGQNVLTHDVYFGTDQALVAAGDPSVAVSMGQEGTTFDPNGLEPLTTYYWRVDEHDVMDAVVAGDVWSFSTFDPEGGAVAQYWDNMALSGEPKVVTTVGEVNFNWPGATVGVDSPDPCIPVDKFSCRWIAELNVATSGTYKFYAASDDGARMYLNGDVLTNFWVDRGTTENASADVELVAGERYQIVMEMYENGGGATAYLRWSGPGIPKEIIGQGALVFPQMAYGPSPANKAANVADDAQLSWTGGVDAVQYNLYFGTDADLVAAGSESVAQGTLEATSFDPGLLLWGVTYYWKVDCITADGTVIPGILWSFATVSDSLIENFEVFGVNPIEATSAPIGWWKLNGDLLDSSGNAHDGKAVGDGIGFEDDPIVGTVLDLPGGNDKFVEIGAVGLSGNMPSSISCWAKADHTSIPDWTLIFGFTGTADGQGGNGSHFNIGSLGGPGGVGAHCWGWEATIFSDQQALEWRHYAMSYDGTTVVYYGDGVTKGTKVHDLSIRGDRVHIGKRRTQASSFPGNVADARVYDYTLTLGEVEMLAGLPVVGDTWVGSGTVAVGMTAAGRSGKAMKLTYDNAVEPFQGDATVSFAEPLDLTRGGVQVLSLWVLGDPCNAPATLFVAMEDSAGALDAVAHPNPAATQMGVWWKVNIPLAEFGKIDLASVAKLTIGVGDGAAGGAGAVCFDDIRFGTPTTVITKVARANGQSGKRTDGSPINGEYVGDTTPVPTQAGGLIDGNFCYSDRNYPWAKTPFEMMGAEYVLMFNNDKAPAEKDVTYTVTISRRTIVWITVDDRIPAEWNADGAVTSPQAAADYVTAAFAAPGTFKDTGLDIFVREKADGSKDRPMSVFAAQLNAGTYVFGAMWSDKNYYTIGAIK